MNFDLNLVGNLVLDRICELETPLRGNASNGCAAMHENTGGIGNLVRALAGRGLNLHVDAWVGQDMAGAFVQQALEEMPGVTTSVKALEEHATSAAVIVVDRARAERTSLVRWGACRAIDAFTPVTSRWTHVSYLDTLDGLTPEALEGLRGRTDTLSVDLCRSDHTPAEKQRLLRRLALVDHAIVADVEAESLTGARGAEAARALGAVVGRSAIVHAPAGSFASDGRQLVAFSAATPLTGLNPLGAGDRFCAALIAQLLASGGRLPAPEHLAHCHAETTAFLKSRT